MRYGTTMQPRGTNVPESNAARETIRAVGAVRGVYLRAGSATIDLHRIRFPDLRINEEAHREAHGREAAEDLAQRGINWAFLSMNWGFPPERERVHWEEFERAVEAYHAAGHRVIGCVEASNCVAEGSYAGRDWYALAPGGRRIAYFRRRQMTCWNHPDWLAEVAGHAERAIRLGADGVFFDNLRMGATPWSLGGLAGGFAGCACLRCVAAFRHSGGGGIPRRLAADETSSTYLTWRARVVEQRLGAWAAAVRRLDPGAVVLANNRDIGLRDTRTLYGIDPGMIAGPQDALLVENLAVPRHDAGGRELIANALAVRAVRALVPDRPALAVTSEQGMGSDRRIAPRRAVRMIAEAAATGAAPVLKGSEYVDSRRRVTVLTSHEFTPMRAAVAPILHWLASRAELFRDARPEADVGVLWNEAAMATRWASAAPPTFAVAMALLREGVAFEFSTVEALARNGSEVRVVLVPPGVEGPDVDDPRVVRVPPDLLDIPGVAPSIAASPTVRWLLDRPLRLLSAAYFRPPRVRRAIDASRVTVQYLRSPFFRVPARSAAIRALLPPGVGPQVRADAPVLVERWRRRDGARLIHLVNYDDAPTMLRLDPEPPGLPLLHTPDLGTRLIATEHRVNLELECYAVLEWTGIG